MAFRNAFDQIYTVKTSLSQSGIVNTFKARIEAASKDKGWVITKDINYKKIQVDEFRAVIKLDPIFPLQLGEVGVAILHFEPFGDITKIQAVVKPATMGLWIIPGFMVFFSGFLFWLIPESAKYIFIALAWLVALTPCYVTIIIRRYRLTTYLKLVLKDIGVNETVIKQYQ